MSRWGTWCRAMLAVMVTCAAVACGSDSGSGGGKTVEGTVPQGAQTAKLNAAIVGEYELEFGNVQEGAPFEAGKQATAIVGDDDTLTILGKTISKPYYLNGNDHEILWNDGELEWALSDNSGGKFNEINLQRASDHKWLGQFADAAKFQQPQSSGDINRMVMLTVSEATSTGQSAPYPQGATITLSWDGAESLTFYNEGGSFSSAGDYVGMEMEGELRVFHWTSGAGSFTKETFLGVDANDKIVSLEARVMHGDVVQASSKAER